MQEDVPTRPANHSPDDPDSTDAQPWLVSYADDDDRDMTAEQIGRALQQGEIDVDTIVWRDGMAEWLPIAQVPQLSHVLRPIAKALLDKKRTVMGGFLAAPRPAEPPRPQNASQLPRNTLIGTGVHLTKPVAAELRPVALGLSPKMPAPGVEDLGESSDLDVELLESVRPGPLEGSSIEFPKLPSQTETVPLPGVRSRGMLDGPISLDPDSIESLPSNALESVVAELPPARAPSAPHAIFEIDSKPPGSPPTQAPKAITTSKAAPHPPRPPLRERSDSPAQYIESLRPEFAASVPPPRGNTFGKVVVFALLAGALGGAMFYLGRQSAPLEPVASTPPPRLTASSVETAATTATSSPSEAEATAATSEKNPSEAPPTAQAESNDPPPVASAPSTAAAPRTPAPQRSTTEVAQRTPAPARDPSPPAPSPAPPPEPESTAAFDTAAASAALNAAAANASSCRSATDPSGVANVTVTFANSGRAINAVVNGPPFAGTVTGGCIASKMRGAKVPPFGGDRITVRKVVVIQ